MSSLRSSIQPSSNLEAKPVAQSRQGTRTTQEILPFKEENLIISDYSSNFIEFQFEEIRLRDYTHMKNSYKLSDTLLNCTLDTALFPQGDANNTLKLMGMLETTNLWDNETFHDSYFTVTPTLRNLAATERPAEVTAPATSFRHQIDPQEQHELSNNTKRMIYNAYLRSHNQYATGSFSQLNNSGLDVDRPMGASHQLDLTTSTIEHRTTLTEEIRNCEHVLNQHLSTNVLNKGMDSHQRLQAAGLERHHSLSTINKAQRQGLQSSRGGQHQAGSLNVSAVLQTSSRPSTAGIRASSTAMEPTTQGNPTDRSAIATREAQINESWYLALQQNPDLV